MSWMVMMTNESEPCENCAAPVRYDEWPDWPGNAPPTGWWECIHRDSPTGVTAWVHHTLERCQRRRREDLP
jgi:hypothetical protein